MPARSAPPRPLDFEALHQRYFEDVSGFIARRIGDDELARDLAQEAFLRAYRARGSYDPRLPIWPWLARIARNLLVNAVRDEGRRRARMEVVEAAEIPGTVRGGDPEAASVNRHLGRTIRRALAEMSPHSRRILLLRCMEGMSHREIADAEGLTEDAVKAQLKRGRTNFRKAFTRLSDEPGSLAVLPFLRRLRLHLRTNHLGLLPNVTLASVVQMVGAAVVATVLVVGGATGPGRHGATNTTPTGAPLGAVSEVSVRTVAPPSGAPAAVSKIAVGAGAPASVTVTTDRSKPAQRTINIRHEDPNGRGGSTGAQLPCDRSPACAVIDQLTSH